MILKCGMAREFTGYGNGTVGVEVKVEVVVEEEVKEVKEVKEEEVKEVKEEERQRVMVTKWKLDI